MKLLRFCLYILRNIRKFQFSNGRKFCFQGRASLFRNFPATIRNKSKRIVYYIQGASLYFPPLAIPSGKRHRLSTFIRPCAILCGPAIHFHGRFIKSLKREVVNSFVKNANNGGYGTLNYSLSKKLTLSATLSRLVVK